MEVIQRGKIKAMSFSLSAYTSRTVKLTDAQRVKLSDEGFQFSASLVVIPVFSELI